MIHKVKGVVHLLTSGPELHAQEHILPKFGPAMYYRCFPGQSPLAVPNATTRPSVVSVRTVILLYNCGNYVTWSPKG